MKLALVCRSRLAFTLTELLVTVAIIIVLAAIALPVFQRAMVSSRRAKGVGNLRQAGAAIMAYAGDNNMTLPGPCGLGVMPYYTGNSISAGALAGILAPYLSLPAPGSLGGNSNYVNVPILVSPGMHAWNAASSQPSSQIPNYIQSDVFIQDGVVIRPFGRVGNYAASPLRLTAVANLGDTTQVWLLSDVDQQSTDSEARASGWFSSLPPKPVYGNVRQRVYADGHVQEVGLDAP